MRMTLSLFYFRLFLVAAVLLILSGCTLPALNLVTPREGYRLNEDIEYGHEERQSLDVYYPTQPRPGAPTLVFFYGGSWQWGYKGGYRFVAQALTELGYRVVVPDYRVYPEVGFPEFVKDGAQAIAQVQKMGLDDQGLVLIGHSAGAHIAALLAMDDTYLAEAGVNRDAILGWVGLSGPYDFLPLKDPEFIAIFGGRDDIPETQPINFASPDDPPALLVYGGADDKVGPQNHINLAERLRQAGVPVQTRVYPDVNHYDTVGAFSVRFRDLSPSFGDTVDFIQALPPHVQ